MSIQELFDKRNRLYHEAKELVTRCENDKRDMSQDEVVQFDKYQDEIRGIKEQIDRLNKLEETRRELESVPAPASREGGNKPQAKTPEEIRAAGFNAYVTGRQMSAEERALQVDSGTAGGFLLPPAEWVSGLIKAIDNRVWIRSLATTYQVMGSDTLGMTSLDADPADPTWVAEIDTGSADSTMAFGKRELKPHPLAQSLRVSRKLLRTAMNAESIVRDRLAYKLSVVLENAYLNGTGANQPLGLFTASNNGIGTGRDTTASATTSFSADDLINCKYAVVAGHRPSCGWIFHRDGVKMAAKLKSGVGDYLFSLAQRNGDQDTLLGAPVYESEYAPNTFTTGLYVGLYGDFSQYAIADSLTAEVQRVDELYAATAQVGFFSRWESDGMPVLSTAFARLKLA